MNKQAHMQVALAAHTNLAIFSLVQSILESGCLYGDVPAAAKIIKICQDEQQRQLAKHDKSMARDLCERSTPQQNSPTKRRNHE